MSLTLATIRVMDIWLPVYGYEGLYEVSDQGRIRSVDRRVVSGSDGRTRLCRGRNLSPATESRGRGHLTVQLWKDNQSCRRYVHVIVLEAFLGPRPDGLEALHFDDDPTNNTVPNLRWGTRSENISDRLRNGRRCNVQKTHCKQGHLYTEETTRVRSDGKRFCITCWREYQREWKRRRRAAAG